MASLKLYMKDNFFAISIGFAEEIRLD